MKRTFSILLILGCLMANNQSFCQESKNIRGSVVDTLEQTVISEASVVILNARDSFMVANTRTDKDGLFLFENVRDGNYILLITYPRYAAYADTFSVYSTTLLLDLKKINLQLKSTILKEIIVGARNTAIRLKGDTTEFIADSFHVERNATVEDLIKRLPGLQVDRNGNITANGQSISKVLVDGEEFFGDDPTLVTRNLRANMVDRIQLYDKASDRAAFTGIDDGQKAKTLNVKLKENKKNGYFGKVELGAGSNGFFQNQGMINSFRGKEKIAGYLTFTNTGLIGLDRRSQKNYAGGDSNPIENDLDKWNGTYEGVGIPKNISGGAHYNNKWNEDKQSINLNYKLGGLSIIGNQHIINRNNLPGSVLSSDAIQNTKNNILRHGLNAEFETNLDSSSTLKIFAESSLVKRRSIEDVTSETTRDNVSLVNKSLRSHSIDAHIKSIHANVLWEKQFKKKRRTLSLGLDATITSNNNEGFFYTKSNFFNLNGTTDSTLLVDQHKVANNYGNVYILNAQYSEPLSKYGSLIIEYKFLMNGAHAELLSFNKSNGDSYTIIDSLYSSDYKFNQFENRGSLTYLYNKSKIRFQIGNEIGRIKLSQKNLFNVGTLNRSFTNWYPHMKFSYKFSALSNFTLSYRGNTDQPTIQQIQPVANNNDPLNIFVGNSKLTPVFTNTLSASYQSFNEKTGGFLGVTGNISIIHNPITIIGQVDTSSGKGIYTYENLRSKNAFNSSGNIFYSRKTTIWDMDFGVNGNLNIIRFLNVVNSTLGVTNVNDYKLSLIISKQKHESYYVGTSFGPTYSTNKNSLQPFVDNNSWGYLISPTIRLTLRSGFLFNTEADYKWQGRTDVFPDNFHRFVWNAWIGKKILKDKNLLIKAAVNDILNQNKGFDRSANNNFIYQNTYSTIARYLLVSVVWDFNKTNGEKSK